IRTAALVNVPVETLELREKIGAGKVAVDDANRIARIVCSHQHVAGVLDRFHVPRGDVAGGADQSEFLHDFSSPLSHGAAWYQWRAKPALRVSPTLSVAATARRLNAGLRTQSDGNAPCSAGRRV